MPKDVEQSTDGKDYNIIVNAQGHTVLDKRLSYADVVKLAFGPEADDPNKDFTVNYRKSDENKHDGELSAGDIVKVKDGTIFNVTSTTRS